MVDTLEPGLEACPICHRTVHAGEAFEWIPVCPLVYPLTEGLRCHAACLAEERELTRMLRREDLRPTFVRFRRAGGREREQRTTEETQ